MTTQYCLRAHTFSASENADDGDLTDAASLRLTLVSDPGGELPVAGGRAVYAAHAISSAHPDVVRGRALTTPILFPISNDRVGIVWVSTDVLGRADEYSTIQACSTEDFLNFTPEVTLISSEATPSALRGIRIGADAHAAHLSYTDQHNFDQEIPVFLDPSLTGPASASSYSLVGSPLSISDATALKLRRMDGSLRVASHRFGERTLLARGIADPQIAPWDDGYLLVGTDDTHQIDSTGVLIRRAADLSEIDTASDHLLFADQPHLKGCFWAPEIHEVDGRLTIFFAPAVGEASWDHVQAYVAQLVGTDPCNPTQWSTPTAVLRPNGSLLSRHQGAPGITLDMTYLRHGDQHIVAWSQRQIHRKDPEGSQIVGDARIWAATIDPGQPSTLTSEPALLLSPEVSWELSTSNVLEGPTFTVRDNRVYLTYSASNIDNSYCIGQASAAATSDLLGPSSWTKQPVPVMRTNHRIDELGPGHHQFLTNPDGLAAITYHARSHISETRDAYIRRADFPPVEDR